MKGGFSFLLFLLILCWYGRALCQTEEFDDSYKDRPLIVKADSLRFAENWDLAITTYEQAENVAKNEKNWAGYVYAINQAGYCYRRSRRLPKARILFDRALEEGIALFGEYHPEIARTYYHLGYYYFSHRDYGSEDWVVDSSLWARQKSIDINEKSSPISPKDMASSYYAMATLQNEGFSNHFEAIEWYEKALDLRLEILPQDDPDLGLTYAYLGFAYYHLDDHLRAQIYINSALDIFEASPKSTAYQKYSAYNNLALAQMKMFEYGSAIKSFEKSIQVVSDRYGPNNWRQINRYNNLGNNYANIGQLDSARKYIHWAIRINLSYPDEIDSIWLADSYSHLGSIYMYQRIFDSAIYYYQKSIPMLRENDSRVSNIYNIIAQIYFNQGLFYESKAACIKSIQTLEPNEENLLVNIEDSRAPMAVFYPAHFLAKTQLNIYNQTNSLQDLTDALNYYHQLEQLKDIIRNEAFSNEAKYQISDQFILSAGEFLTALASDPTEFAFHERNEIVFGVMERNRYSELFRNVINIQNSSQLDVPDSLLQLEKLLASQISVYHKNLPDESDSIKTSQLFKYERKYQKVKQALSATFPSYYESKFGKELIDLKTIQSILEENEQILEYFWGDSLISILSITSDTSRLHYSPISESLEKQILEFHSFCSEVPSGLTMEEQLYKEYELGAVDLFEKLVKPLLISETNQLIIIPDGPISLIPFEALLTKFGHSSFYNAPFLIRDINIRYGYSCNLLFQGTEKIVVKRPSLLAMAYSNGNTSPTDLERKDETNIPGSGLELISIRKIFKQKNHIFLFGNEATETAFKAKASNFEIIHLAVHGTGDTTNAFNSHLIFPDLESIEDDGRLYAHELYALDLQRLNLVVLSSCKTGIGKEYPGEGIFSMARGFRYSGASTIVMSLWNVTDNATADIMELFYYSLSSGKPVSESLRQAKLGFIDNNDSKFSHPAYWAAFVSIGDDYRIKSGSNYRKIIPISFGLLIIAMIILWKRNKSRLESNMDIQS